MSTLRLTRKHTSLVTDNSNQTLANEPCVVGDVSVSNPNTSQVWIQFFDALTADVTVGTTVADLAYPCTPGDGVNSETCSPISAESKVQFAIGCTYAITTTRLGSTAPTLDVVVNGLYRKG